MNLRKSEPVGRSAVVEHAFRWKGNRTKVENTSKREPMEHLVGALGGTTQYIEGMEAAGQRELVNSTVHAYSDDGRRYEVEVAPDGSIVERREFQVEPPEDDRW